MYRRNVMDVLPIKNVQILTRKVRHIITHWQKNAEFSKKQFVFNCIVSAP